MIVLGDYVFQYFKDLKKKVLELCTANNQVETIEMYEIPIPDDDQFGNPEDNPYLTEGPSQNVVEHIR